MLNLDHIPTNEPLKIIIGAGEQSYPGWIATHKEQLDLLDRDGWIATFRDRRVDAFLCEHVWEHLTETQARQAAKLCYDFLKPGGYLRCAVPDANYLDEEYQRGARGDVPPDHSAFDHKIVYNYKLFVDIFQSVGFEVDLLEYCDENGRFHYNDYDQSKGIIYRSLRVDHRNKEGDLGFVSLIVDAIRTR
jgi:predicted SAM-dependent methyltransferase